jgi:ribA/ribD-fused uncharacterized protein
MHQKAVLSKDNKIAQQILQTNDPVKAKQLGKNIQNFSLSTWRERCLDIMCTGLRQKFTQNQRHKDFLIATGNSTIVEASPHDNFWGVGKSLFDRHFQI